MRHCHNRRWSCRSSNTDHGPPDPSPERMVKSLHHRPRTKVRQTTFWAIDCTLRSGFRRDSWLIGLRQTRVCNRMNFWTWLKRCFFGVLRLRCSWFRFVLASSKFREPRFILILRSRLRQIQFWKLLCGSVWRGLLIHWRFLLRVDGSCLTLTGGLTWCGVNNAFRFQLVSILLWHLRFQYDSMSLNMIGVLWDNWMSPSSGWTVVKNEPSLMR